MLYIVIHIQCYFDYWISQDGEFWMVGPVWMIIRTFSPDWMFDQTFNLDWMFDIEHSGFSLWRWSHKLYTNRQWVSIVLFEPRFSIVNISLKFPLYINNHILRYFMDQYNFFDYITHKSFLFLIFRPQAHTSVNYTYKHIQINMAWNITTQFCNIWASSAVYILVWYNGTIGDVNALLWYANIPR